MYIFLGIIALAATVGAMTLFMTARNVPYDDVATTKFAAWGFSGVSLVTIGSSVMVITSEPIPGGEWVYLLAAAGFLAYVFHWFKRYARGDWA